MIRRRPALILATLLIAAAGSLSTAAASAETPSSIAAATAAGPVPGTYVPVAPARLVDTRNGTGTTKAQIKAGGTLVVQIGGKAGIPSSGLGAVAINVNVVNATAAGRLIVWAAGTARPDMSSVNFVAALAATSLVVSRVSTAGKFAVYNSAATPIDLIVDVSGYWIGGTVTAGGGFVPVTPTRSLDTRSGIGASRSDWQSNGEPGGYLSWQVSGRNAVPIDASAVVMAVTATNVAASGSLLAYEDDPMSGPGLWSWLFEYDVTLMTGMAPTRNVPLTNLFVVPLSDTGVAALNSSVLAGEPQVDYGFDVLADVIGYITTGAATVPGTFQPLPIGQLAQVTIQARATYSLQTPVPAGATAMFQVTASATAGGGLVAYQGGTAAPTTRNLNFNAGQRVSNTVLVKTSSTSAVSLQNLSSGNLTVTVELTGYSLTTAPATGNAVWAGGMNFAGGMGQGFESGRSATGHLAPVGLTDVVSVASHWGTSLAATADGTLWAWGNDANDFTVDGGGMLGNGPGDVNQSRPTAVPVVHDVVSVGISIELVWALQRDGTVWRWGWLPFGSLPSPQQVVGLSDIVSVDGDLAVRRDGAVLRIQLADASELPFGSCAPAGCWEGVPIPGLSLVVDASYIWMVRTDGTVVRFEDGMAAPVAVPGLTGVVDVAGNFARRSNGELWLLSADGPATALSLTGVVAVSRQGCAVTSDGAVWSLIDPAVPVKRRNVPLAAAVAPSEDLIVAR